MLSSIGPGELVIILVIVLLLFGAKKVPEIAKSLGRSISEFKKGMSTTTTENEEEKNK